MHTWVTCIIYRRPLRIVLQAASVVKSTQMGFWEGAAGWRNSRGRERGEERVKETGAGRRAAGEDHTKKGGGGAAAREVRGHSSNQKLGSLIQWLLQSVCPCVLGQDAESLKGMYDREECNILYGTAVWMCLWMGEYLQCIVLWMVARLENSYISVHTVKSPYLTFGIKRYVSQCKCRF